MENKYYLNYIKSIKDGLEKIVYCLNQQEISPDLFFQTIKDELIFLKTHKGKIYFFGNGASAAFANHMALDFSKNGKISSRSLSDNALLTALSNDFSYEMAMVEFLKLNDLSIRDLVITISSSGNSPNIINVLNYCKENNFKSLALSGLKADNKSIKLAGYSVYVPMMTYGMVECIHQIILHLILDEYMGIQEWSRDDFQNMNFLDLKL